MTDGTERTSPLAIADTAANEGSGVSSLDVGGEPVKLDALGPMIINSDGTLSRITNWHELGEIERERTVRLLAKKRNLVRLNRLEKELGQSGERLSALGSKDQDEDEAPKAKKE